MRGQHACSYCIRWFPNERNEGAGTILNEVPMIKEGDKAPDFTLPATGGARVRLSDLRGSNVVLYFYPKDNTPGCTKEACSFRDQSAALKRAGAIVLGVSTDSVASHEKFAKKYGLPFPLLSDEDKSVVKAYGVWKKKSLYGRLFKGVERTTFLINDRGVVARVFPKVKVEGHTREVLDALKNL